MEGHSFLGQAASYNPKSKQNVPMLEHHMLLANWGEFDNQFLDLYVYTLIPRLFLKPYLMAHIFAILFEAMPIWMEKPFIHLPLLSLNTPPPLALPGLYL